MKRLFQTTVKNGSTARPPSDKAVNAAIDSILKVGT